MKKILIDGDILVYSTAFSVETPIYVVKGGVYKSKAYAEKKSLEVHYPVNKRVNIGSVKDLRRNLDLKLNQIYEDLESTDKEIYITQSKVEGNFRSKIATILPYKGNRFGSIKPYHYNTIRKILVDEYGAILVKGQEADDAISIRQTELYQKHKSFDKAVIASIDKDFKTVPGYFYNINERVTEFIDKDVAEKNFYKQILSGDSADNIPGLYRLLKENNRLDEAKKLMGEKYLSKYEKAVVDLSPKQAFQYVKDQYYKYGFTDKEINEIGNLLYLRRFEGQIWSEGL